MFVSPVCHESKQRWLENVSHKIGVTIKGAPSGGILITTSYVMCCVEEEEELLQLRFPHRILWGVNTFFFLFFALDFDWQMNS